MGERRAVTAYAQPKREGAKNVAAPHMRPLEEES